MPKSGYPSWEMEAGLMPPDRYAQFMRSMDPIPANDWPYEFENRPEMNMQEQYRSYLYDKFESFLKKNKMANDKTKSKPGFKSRMSAYGDRLSKQKWDRTYRPGRGLTAKGHVPPAAGALDLFGNTGGGPAPELNQWDWR